MTFNTVHLAFLLCHLYTTFVCHFNNTCHNDKCQTDSASLPQKQHFFRKIVNHANFHLKSLKLKRIQNIGSLRILNKKPALSVFQACLLKKCRQPGENSWVIANRIGLRKNWKFSLGAGNGSIATIIKHFLKVSC